MLLSRLFFSFRFTPLHPPHPPPPHLPSPTPPHSTPCLHYKQICIIHGRRSLTLSLTCSRSTWQQRGACQVGKDDSRGGGSEREGGLQSYITALCSGIAVTTAGIVVIGWEGRREGGVGQECGAKAPADDQQLPVEGQWGDEGLRSGLRWRGAEEGKWQHNPQCIAALTACENVAAEVWTGWNGLVSLAAMFATLKKPSQPPPAGWLSGHEGS